MTERVVLTGMMGSGKSVVGRILARRLDIPFVDLDRMIETAEAMSIARIFSSLGEPAFREIESRHLAAACRASRGVLATGGGVVLSAENRRRLRRWGTVVYLRATAGTLLGRLTEDEKKTRPLLGAADPAAALRSLLESRRALYEKAKLTVDTEGLTADAVADSVLRAIAEKGAAEGEKP
ncbi:MAG: shikimate kinase [Candidatus Eisenbacteria bacterium]